MYQVVLDRYKLGHEPIYTKNPLSETFLTQGLSKASGKVLMALHRSDQSTGQAAERLRELYQTLRHCPPDVLGVFHIPRKGKHK